MYHYPVEYEKEKARALKLIEVIISLEHKLAKDPQMDFIVIELRRATKDYYDSLIDA